MTDKHQYLILAVAVILALGSSVAAFLSQRVAEIPISAKAVNPAWESLAATATRLEQILAYKGNPASVWREPESLRDEGEWRYDLFTPPRIFIHPETGEFQPRSYQYAQKRSLPSLELISVSRPLFRYQLSGYVEHPSGLTEHAVILIEDTHLRNNLRLRLSEGGSLDDGYTLQSFSVERRESESGAIQRFAVAEVREPGGCLVFIHAGVPAHTSGLVVCVRWRGQELIFSEAQSSHAMEGHTITWNAGKEDAQSLHFLVSSDDGAEPFPVVFPINPDLL